MPASDAQVDTELQSFRHDVTNLLLREAGRPNFADDGILSRYYSQFVYTQKFAHGFKKQQTLDQCTQGIA